MRAIAVENAGPHYRLVVRDLPNPAPKHGEVLIAVAAAGLNRADLLQAEDHYPPPPGAPDILGMEVSGTIAALGDDVADLALGQEVCALIPGGGYAELAVADRRCVLPVPRSAGLIQAAALPEACFTVWTNLMDTARLKPGESLLVHGGTSGIGSLAIQLFTALGHPVFATAGSAVKCQACEAFGAVRAIDYTCEDFVAVIKDATHGKGVDVILDMVGGDYIQRNMQAAAPWCRIVNIAYQKGMTATVDFAPMLMKRLSLLATTLRGRTNAEKGAIRDAVARTVWPLLETGRIHPVVDGTFPLAEAGGAHARMRGSGHIGKILLIT